VAPRAFLVLVRWVKKLDPEILPRPILERFAKQIENDEQRALRDLSLLLDRGSHGAVTDPKLT
jgi:hypothetical protein